MITGILFSSHTSERLCLESRILSFLSDQGYPAQPEDASNSYNDVVTVLIRCAQPVPDQVIRLLNGHLYPEQRVLPIHW